jgi:hypothetical protein
MIADLGARKRLGLQSSDFPKERVPPNSFGAFT